MEESSTNRSGTERSAKTDLVVVKFVCPLVGSLRDLILPLTL